MPENEDFCLSFELFSWVSDFLSFGVLEFSFGGAQKKPVLTATVQATEQKNRQQIPAHFSPPSITGTPCYN